MQVTLATPIFIAGRETATIELRPPGRKVFDAMRTARGPARFPEASIIRFAARLSAHDEGTFRRLGDQDLVAVSRAVETLYVQARRRFIARSAIQKGELE